MFIDYIKGKGASEISIHHPSLLLLPNEKVLGASPDGVFCSKPGTANIPTSFVVEYKNPKKLVDAGLTVCEVVDTKVPKRATFAHQNRLWGATETYRAGLESETFFRNSQTPIF